MMKMFCLLMFALFTLAASTDDDLMLSAALSSPRKMVSLYSTFEKSHGRQYQPAEERMRLRIFSKTVQEVALLNSHTTWHSALNGFADKTEEEKRGYLGLNVSRVLPLVSPPMLTSSLAAPATKSWISEGAVTEVKNQLSCGSCWAFSAIASLEGRYKMLTGVLRQMSEEHMLDCSTGDGCEGGYMGDGINWLRDNGVLASATSYPYRGYDGYCDSGFDDVIKGAVVIGYQQLSADSNVNEMTTINALTSGPVSITFKVIDSFYSYKSDIYSDYGYPNSPNHAMTAVAYTPQYILVKNSWASSWGDNGFVKLARNWYGCAMHMYVGHPVISRSDQTDNSQSDPTTRYNPEGSAELCKDDYDNCDLFKIYCSHDKVKRQCRKSCGMCGSEGACPSGTTECRDGVCRHIHMC